MKSAKNNHFLPPDIGVLSNIVVSELILRFYTYKSAFLIPAGRFDSDIALLVQNRGFMQFGWPATRPDMATLYGYIAFLAQYQG